MKRGFRYCTTLEKRRGSPVWVNSKAEDNNTYSLSWFYDRHKISSPGT